MEMIHINLLPKEYRRKRGGLSFGKTGFYAIGVVVGAILLISTISLYQAFQLRELNDKMEEARFRTKQLEKDIAVVDALTDVKGKIMQRMTAVDKLDQHRIAWVRILEDINRNMPEYSWLSHFEEKSVSPVADNSKTANKNHRRKEEQNKTVAAAADSEKTVLLSEFPNTVPIELEGYSFNLSATANLMINMMKSHFFSDVEMESVEEVDFNDQKAYNYKLTATMHYLSDQELRKILEQESGPELLASF